MNKKGIEFSFGWIFAIIIGASILALGLFTASKIINQEEYRGNSINAKEFGILTTALETSLETSKTDKITFDTPSRIVLECDPKGVYGLQKISSGDFKKETTGVTSTFAGKYFFSEKIMDGKEFIVLSKPFNYPYRVANILIIWPKNTLYCFLDPPEQTEKELQMMMRDNALINSSLQILPYNKKEECRIDSKKVCFGKTSSCDIAIYDSTIKKGDRAVFIDPSEQENALIFAAIFSDPEIYECQMQRLMHRASTLAHLYQEKAILLEGRGCTSSLMSSLENYAVATKSFNSTKELATLSFLANTLGGENDQLSCPVF